MWNTNQDGPEALTLLACVVYIEVYVVELGDPFDTAM